MGQILPAQSRGRRGRQRGSISGGCVEGAVHDLCRQVLRHRGAPQRTRCGDSDDDAFAVGLTCGGERDVLVQRIDQLARLRSPIGLGLGARTPQETAVSITAEIIAHAHLGTGLPLSQATGPIHRPLPLLDSGHGRLREEAADPGRPPTWRHGNAAPVQAAVS
ncbi:xanthine/CO dehydrogenase XdhC/CoxF family maturation factor [Streptomyces rishiriensis]|uniref:Xanthine/CO dehydrogenase XdhC/CoxF family maturation factor n=1 Tax=Streptomyces rishiriensis TaxID=68264 RepID=A0ABU0P2S6_STRRH|nr:xanthine/CO dehydrogenase XdhC/CoxF family maturation factor [Streptomyces rishiriensis]